MRLHPSVSGISLFTDLLFLCANVWNCYWLWEFLSTLSRISSVEILNGEFASSSTLESSKVKSKRDCLIGVIALDLALEAETIFCVCLILLTPASAVLFRCLAIAFWLQIEVDSEIMLFTLSQSYSFNFAFENFDGSSFSFSCSFLKFELVLVVWFFICLNSFSFC